MTPVLDINEAAAEYKENFMRNDDIVSPQPAPDLSRTPAVSNASKPFLNAGQHTEEIMEEAGYSKTDIEKLIKNDIIFTLSKI